MTTTTARKFSLRDWHRECNYYCRDGNHAEVAWDSSTGATPETFASSAGALGLKVLKAQPAPEAQPHRTGWVMNSAGQVVRGYTSANPYLLTVREM